MAKKNDENVKVNSAKTKKSEQVTKAKAEPKPVTSTKSPNEKAKKSKTIPEIVKPAPQPAVKSKSADSAKPKAKPVKAEAPKTEPKKIEVKKENTTLKAKITPEKKSKVSAKPEVPAPKVEVPKQTKSSKNGTLSNIEKTAAKKTVKEVATEPKSVPPTTPKKQVKSKAQEIKPVSKKTVKEPEPKKAKEQTVETPAPVQKISETLKKNVPAQETVEIEEESFTEALPVRYSDEELEMFEKVITEAKRESFEELRMLKERLEDLNTYDLAEESMFYSMHMGEQGSEPMEKEKTYAQIQRINEYIKKLDEALQRIKDKTYGICRMCGILIAKERLMAVPITTLSASWKIHQRCPDDRIDRIEPFVN